MTRFLIDNLPPGTYFDQLHAMFACYGNIDSISIGLGGPNARNASIELSDLSVPEALSAAETLDGSIVNGRRITVRVARERSLLPKVPR